MNKQTKKESWREAYRNTFAAFIISMMAHWLIVAPVLQWNADRGGDNTTLVVAFFITCFYTALSLVRNYLIRRAHA